MNKLLEKIRSRGYWRVIIRPGTFIEDRVNDIASLYPILEKTSVQIRGWDFPHLDTKHGLHIDTDWIQQESEWEEYLEFWRFYQSGQFIDFFALDEDWLNQRTRVSNSKGNRPGLFLDVEDTLFQFTEIFEFASRLSLTEAGDEQMHIEITLNGLKERFLRLAPSRISPHATKASIQAFPYKEDLQRIQLITEPRELALKLASELFKRFGWNASLEILRDIQDELVHRGSRVGNT